MPLDPGDFRTRLQVQFPVRTYDAQRSLIVQWAVVRNLSCAVMPVTDPASNSEYRRLRMGDEKPYAASTLATATHLIYSRAQSFRVTPEMRLVNLQNSVAFNVIEAIELKQIRGEVRIFTKESPADNVNVQPLWACVVDSNGSFAIDASGKFGVTLL